MDAVRAVTQRQTQPPRPGTAGVGLIQTPCGLAVARRQPCSCWLHAERRVGTAESAEPTCCGAQVEGKLLSNPDTDTPSCLPLLWGHPALGLAHSWVARTPADLPLQASFAQRASSNVWRGCTVSRAGFRLCLRAAMSPAWSPGAPLAVLHAPWVTYPLKINLPLVNWQPDHLLECSHEIILGHRCCTGFPQKLAFNDCFQKVRKAIRSSN